MRVTQTCIFPNLFSSQAFSESSHVSFVYVRTRLCLSVHLNQSQLTTTPDKLHIETELSHTVQWYTSLWSLVAFEVDERPSACSSSSSQPALLLTYAITPIFSYPFLRSSYPFVRSSYQFPITLYVFMSVRRGPPLMYMHCTLKERAD